MKILLLIPILLLSGCVTGPDGETRVDWDGVSRGVDMGFDAYGKYRNLNATPVYAQPIYHNGAVIYPQ